ncbi:hypothetical protein VNO77_19165 [Canavalia gladiata]|uniref:Uncharacterized protein n=1 Tax=Canavalia gladiata TaxID=3824 RepID=A0AAN9LM96_CANGL
MQRVVTGDGLIHDFSDSVTHNDLMVVYMRVEFLEEKLVILYTIANRGDLPRKTLSDLLRKRLNSGDSKLDPSGGAQGILAEASKRFSTTLAMFLAEKDRKLSPGALPKRNIESDAPKSSGGNPTMDYSRVDGYHPCSSRKVSVVAKPEVVTYVGRPAKLFVVPETWNRLVTINDEHAERAKTSATLGYVTACLLSRSPALHSRLVPLLSPNDDMHEGWNGFKEVLQQIARFTPYLLRSGNGHCKKQWFQTWLRKEEAILTKETRKRIQGGKLKRVCISYTQVLAGRHKVLRVFSPKLEAQISQCVNVSQAQKDNRSRPRP